MKLSYTNSICITKLEEIVMADEKKVEVKVEEKAAVKAPAKKVAAKKAANLGGDVYVVAAEKKIYDTDGNAVELF